MSALSLKVLIVEDNLSFSLQLQIMLEKLGHFICGRVASSMEALQKVHAEHPDLILMDIDIKGKMTGVEVGHKIANLNIPLLYISSHQDDVTYQLAQQSNMIGFLVKPVDKISLQSTIQLAIEKANSIKNEEDKTSVLNVEDKIVTKSSLFFKKRDVLHKVMTRDVSFIRAADIYSETVTIKGEIFSARLSLGKLEKMLPQKTFMRVHRQYIIQVAQIDSINMAKNILTIGEEEIPISRYKKKELEEVMNLIK